MVVVQVVYEFNAHGLSMQWLVDISHFMASQTYGHINSLARIGIRLSLSSDLQRCTWMGRCFTSLCWSVCAQLVT